MRVYNFPEVQQPLIKAVNGNDTELVDLAYFTREHFPIDVIRLIGGRGGRKWSYNNNKDELSYIADFMRISGISKFIWVANTNDKNFMKPIEFLQNYGECILIEAGNEEYYHIPWWRKLIGGNAIRSYAKSYIKKAERIQSAFPNIPVAVCCGGHSGRNNPIWNQVLFDSDFDDCTFHPYPEPTKNYFETLDYYLRLFRKHFMRIHATEYHGLNFGPDERNRKNMEHHSTPLHAENFAKLEEVLDQNYVPFETRARHSLYGYKGMPYHKIEGVNTGKNITDFKILDYDRLPI